MALISRKTFLIKTFQTLEFILPSSNPRHEAHGRRTKIPGILSRIMHGAAGAIDTLKINAKSIDEMLPDALYRHARSG